MIKNVFYAFLIFTVSSCAFFNDKEVSLPIKSNPSGASIYIDGQYFGQTPAQVRLIPDKNYKATIAKKGYGSSNISLESWVSAREKRGGADMARCFLDMAGVMLVVPIVSFMSVHCRDFKQKEYLVNLVGDPNQVSGLGGNGYNAAPLNNGYNPYDAYNGGGYSRK